MPLFDYICKACGKEFETLVFGNDTPQCPQCKSKDLEKQMSSFAVRTSSGAVRNAAGGASKCSGCVGRSCKTCH